MTLPANSEVFVACSLASAHFLVKRGGRTLVSLLRALSKVRVDINRGGSEYSVLRNRHVKILDLFDLLGVY